MRPYCEFAKEPNQPKRVPALLQVPVLPSTCSELKLARSLRAVPYCVAPSMPTLTSGISGAAAPGCRHPPLGLRRLPNPARVARLVTGGQRGCKAGQAEQQHQEHNRCGLRLEINIARIYGGMNHRFPVAFTATPAICRS